MKGDLPKREPPRLSRWETEDLYGRIRAARKGRPVFLLHDGPPYANGSIHMGTSMNKILKDLVVRSKTLAGFDAPYVPGWDCHGLPIELKVDKELGPKKREMSDVAIRQACRAYAEKWIDVQRTDFKRLGVLGAWNAPYRTMDFSYQSEIARAFGDVRREGSRQLRLQGGPLVRPRPDGAGRGRDRVRGQDRLVDLRRPSSRSGLREGRLAGSRLRRPCFEAERHHLDDDAVDAAGEPRHRARYGHPVRPHREKSFRDPDQSASRRRAARAMPSPRRSAGLTGVGRKGRRVPPHRFRSSPEDSDTAVPSTSTV